jgi:hypothetical protein
MTLAFILVALAALVVGMCADMIPADHSRIDRTRDVSVIVLLAALVFALAFEAWRTFV